MEHSQFLGIVGIWQVALDSVPVVFPSGRGAVAPRAKRNALDDRSRLGKPTSRATVAPSMRKSNRAVAGETRIETSCQRPAL